MNHRSGEAGLTLIETVIALAILFIVTAGMMGLGVLGTITTENQGHLAARTTEYAQDKMEQLLSLSYSDGDAVAAGSASNTISPSCVRYLVTDACTTGGAGIKVGGSTTARTLYYVDFLSEKGEPLGGVVTGPPGWFYERRWAITLPSAHLKQITVWTTVRSVIGPNSAGLQPVAILSSYKTDPF